MTDEKLIEKILHGDRRTASQFYRIYAPKLLTFIRRKVGNVRDCEEILQDTLYAFLENLRDFQGNSNLQTYLFSICQHKIVDHYRKKKIKQVVFSQIPQIESFVAPFINPEEALDSSITREKISMVFKKLLPRYRKAIFLKYLDGMSVADMAEKLSVTAKGAESLLFRARKAFVEIFISI